MKQRISDWLSGRRRVRRGSSRDDPRESSGAIFDLWNLLSRPRFANEAVIRSLCANAYLGGGTSLCRVLGRYKMYVDSNDLSLTSHLLVDGFWEMWVTEAMLSRLRPGMRAIDVGANVGYYTLLMSDVVGPTGRVLAFEPNPAIAARLRKTVFVNGLPATTDVHEFALGSVEGKLSLVVPDFLQGSAHVVPHQPDGAFDTVCVRRLDSFADALDADLIKIDAEGAEEQVWAGMEEILARDRPLSIFLEYTPCRYSDAAAFLDDLLRPGFALHYIDYRHGVRPTTREAVLSAPANEEQMLVLIR